MVLNKPEQNGKLVIFIESSLRDGKHGMKAFPGLLKKAIKSEAWREYYSETLRQNVIHKTFEAFVTEHMPDGLGSTIDQIKSICHADLEALDAIDKAIVHKAGDHVGNQYTIGTVDNIHDSNRPTGTSQAAGLRRLRNTAPEIHKDVLAGKKSVNAGMIEAGYRQKTVTVKCTVEGFTKCMQKHLTQEQIGEIIKKLLPANLKQSIDI